MDHEITQIAPVDADNKLDANTPPISDVSIEIKVPDTQVPETSQEPPKPETSQEPPKPETPQEPSKPETPQEPPKPNIPQQQEVAHASQIKSPWVCKKCGAIMGSVYHEKIRQGLSLSRLIIFRIAVRIDEVLPLNLIFGKVDAGEFGCSRCGEIQTWNMSPETMRYFSEGNHHVKRKNRNV